MKDALALALVHFIWQGAVLAIVGALLMRVTKVPTVRYAIGVATMVAMLLAPVATFLAIYNSSAEARRPAESVISSPHAALADGARTSSSVRASSSPYAAGADAVRGVVIPTTWILSAWLVGVMILSL